MFLRSYRDFAVKFHCVEFVMGPLAVHDIFLGDGAAVSAIDRSAINQLACSATYQAFADLFPLDGAGGWRRTPGNQYRFQSS
jgi:hypothetical protein